MAAPRAKYARTRPMRIDHAQVGGRQIRYAARPGDPGVPPLLILNGLGANIELAQPFIDALTRPTVVIFDVPGVGGSPTPPMPYRPSGVARLAASLLDHLGHRRSRCARRVVGWCDRAAIRAAASHALSTSRARCYGAGRADGARKAVGAAEDDHAASIHRPPTCAARRRRMSMAACFDASPR